MNKSNETSEISAQIAALDDLSLTDLSKRWSRMHNCSVPTGFSRDLIIRGIAYKIQEQSYGGLSQASKRKLQTLAKQLDEDKTGGFDLGPILKPGAKLIREWQARTYTVTVLNDGFELDGHRYGSLSKIAREITGVRWSGPRFFGLRKEVDHVEG